MKIFLKETELSRLSLVAKHSFNSPRIDLKSSLLEVPGAALIRDLKILLKRTVV